MIMESKTTTREVQRIRYDLKIRDVKVSDVRQIGANMLSVTFQGDALADFVSLSFDDHVKFIFPDATGTSVRRDYTPCNHDGQRKELVLEFALHAEGAATDWARRAKVGMDAVIAGPRGSMVVPTDYDWHLLVGDLSAVPAISRRLKELAPGAKVTAIVEVEQMGDIRQFETLADLDIKWVSSGEELLTAIRNMDLPAGDGYIWAAGEAATMKSVRAVLADEKRHPKEAMRVSAYWKRGATDFHEKLD